MRIGIIGGGQLGRMLALAGHPLGMDFLVLEPADDCPAAPVAPVLTAAYDDRAALKRFASEVDVATFEFENVDAESVRFLAEQVAVFPPPEALFAAQDRMREKKLFEQLHLPVAPFAAVVSREDLADAVVRIGLPAVLKTRRHGYDGKGQRVLRTSADVEPAYADLAGRPLLLESWIPFERELSILVARGRDGDTGYYPLIENRHEGGILRTSRVPVTCDTDSCKEALRGVGRLLEQLDYVGVLALELFEVQGEFLANEMAPRVHNSGHWTMDGAVTSQFENHLRAVCGLPLGQASAIGAAGMVNLIGHVPPLAELLAVPGARVHLYGKSPRPHRKLGHVNVHADDPAKLVARMDHLLAIVAEHDPAEGRPA